MKAYIFLADGFEEVEALTTVDVLRRAGIETVMVSIAESGRVCGAHSICVMADTMFDSCDFSDASALILPGGMPGTNNLAVHEGLRAALRRQYERGELVAAICAAPSIFGQLGFLKGRRAVCFPGFEDKLEGAQISASGSVTDGNVITGRSMGTAIPFALEIVAKLLGSEKSKKLEQGLCI